MNKSVYLGTMKVSCVLPTVFNSYCKLSRIRRSFSSINLMRYKPVMVIALSFPI